MHLALTLALWTGQRQGDLLRLTWLFPSDAPCGHMTEHKEDRSVLSHWGNDLRQTYRTLAQAAEVSEVDMHLLMNHALPGVNSGYITRSKLMRDHLRAQQERLSVFFLGTVMGRERGVMEPDRRGAHDLADVANLIHTPDVALIVKTEEHPTCHVSLHGSESPLANAWVALGGPPSQRLRLSDIPATTGSRSDSQPYDVCWSAAACGQLRFCRNI